MADLNRRGKEKMSDRVKHFFQNIRMAFKHNRVLVRMLQLAICFFLIFGGIGLGFLNSKAEQNERARTLSDIDQELSFSITDSTLKLQPQSRNGDTVVVPFQIEGMNKLSSDASNYTLTMSYADGKPLPEDMSAVLALFGSSGDGAIVLSGSFEPGPLQIFIRDDSGLGFREGTTGKLNVSGQSIDVDFNAVTFTVNPRAEGIEEDELVSPTMSFKDLYYVALGKHILQSMDTDEAEYNKVYEDKLKLKSEYEARLASFNEALGLPKGDTEEIKEVKTKRRYDRDSLREYLSDEEMNSLGSELSTSDIQSLRNETISEINKLESELVTIEETLNDIEGSKEDMQLLIDDMNNITTLSETFTVQDKE